MLQFWSISVASLVWLVPLPLGAYIFLSKREVYIYSAYAILIIFTVITIASLCDFEFVKHTNEQIRVTDTFLIISNFLIVTLLVYYKDKIRRLEIISEIEEKEKIVLPVTLDEKDAQYAASLFERIENVIEQDELFKNPKLNISTLSTILEVNNNYISKAIRYKGYPNFNSYINSHRIAYVKKLIAESDLDRVTLMYIYTEAGFLNQSTFNRTFKQIEEITPSEYIQKMKNKARASVLS
ncbi:helix-turn-helix domain-containing protein [Chryseobacterium sp. CT-SW4]|uniref:helix-turn-helix domain-containing protein n=1 Tax=Chryseobacterium sp. SW-1 TaxID=3157343 RepID=UPI003B018A99